MMTSPTKLKLRKENPDMVALKDINAYLYQNLQNNLDFLEKAEIKHFIDNPNNLSALLTSRNMIEEIDKLLLTSEVDKIRASLHQWQTDLIHHYERLLKQVKVQPYAVIIKFLQQNFAVDLMQSIPLTPRKSARLQARGLGSVQRKKEEDQQPVAELSHHKSVARKLLFDFNTSVKSDSFIEQTADKSRTSPRVKN